MMNNIDASETSTWSGGFTPIGTDTGTAAFAGTFEGNGRKITGLTINRSASATFYTGFFGYTNGATIRNIGLEGGSITGTITSTATCYVGGLVGYNTGTGSITTSYSTATVSAASTSTTIAATNVTYAGGLVGYNTGANAAITHCYSLGAVSSHATANAVFGTSNSYAGGLIGNNSNATIYRCYSAGAVSATRSGQSGTATPRGLIAAVTSGTYTNCFWDTQTSGQSSSAAGTGRTTANMKTQSQFTNWDFNAVWFMNGGYPVLRAFLFGGVSVAIEPEDAVTLGAQWNVNGGATWYNTGDTVSDLPIGSYTIAFKAIADWHTPASQTISIVDATIPMSATYVPVTYPVVPDGTGTSADPYQIAELGNLVWMGEAAQVAASSGKYYSLTSNLDASATAAWPGGFTPIGSSATSAFAGTFDGSGNKITGLTVNRSAATALYVGMFGFTNGATIRNLGLEGGSMTANVSASVNCHVGGLVGYNTGIGSISICYSTNTVRATGTRTTGTGGTVNTYAGGLVGFNTGAGAGINNSYATGAVTATATNASAAANAYAGGLIGSTANATILRCYSAGAVSATRSGSSGTAYPRGLSYAASGTHTNCFWDATNSGASTSAGNSGGSNRTTTQMQTQTQFTSWDFANVWIMNGYPQLRAFLYGGISVTIEPDIAIAGGAQWNINGGATWYDSGETVDHLNAGAYTVSFKPVADWNTPASRIVNIMTEIVTTTGVYVPVSVTPTGTGTEADPYQINQIGHLIWMGIAANITASAGKSYRLMNDIDAGITANMNSGAGFEPIGSATNAFAGTFDGNSKKITELYVNKSSSTALNVGFFGQTAATATVKNVAIEGGSITAGVSAAVSAYVGGLVGTNNGTISNCYATGNVTGNGNTTLFTNSHGYAGGLVGNNYGAIFNCYATGNCVGKGGGTGGNGVAGGLVAVSNGGTIDNCYSLGTETSTGTGTNSKAGGLLGRHVAGTYTKCFWDTTTSARSTSDGGAGVVGKTDPVMKQHATFAAWDFATVWIMNEGATYPLLRTFAAGALDVTLAPQVAIDLGAQWSIDGGATWHDNGVADVVADNYSVTFKTVSGWASPADQPVTVGVGQTLAVSATYNQQINSGVTLEVDENGNATSTYGDSYTLSVSGATPGAVFTVVKTLLAEVPVELFPNENGGLHREKLTVNAIGEMGNAWALALAFKPDTSVPSVGPIDTCYGGADAKTKWVAQHENTAPAQASVTISSGQIGVSGVDLLGDLYFGNEADVPVSMSTFELE